MKSLAVLALLALLPAPCGELEQKQFDFWVPGEKAGETGHGANSINRVMEGCVVEELYRGRVHAPTRDERFVVFAAGRKMEADLGGQRGKLSRLCG